MTVDNHTALPPLPEPYSVASTIKCVACGEPYRPSIPVARPMFSGITTNACKCGGTTFGGTFVEGPSPAVYTADQLRTYGKECMRLALSSPAWVDLSAAPPSRKPLSTETIFKFALESDPEIKGSDEAVINFTRRIERAHGIGEG
jgi:hypothetical protein